MNPTVEESRRGSYTEPFQHTQYGAFVTKADGSVRFVAATLASAEHARTLAEDYYREMSKNSLNNMDMTDLDRIEIRTRTVTYGVWDE